MSMKEALWIQRPQPVHRIARDLISVLAADLNHVLVPHFVQGWGINRLAHGQFFPCFKFQNLLDLLDHLMGWIFQIWPNSNISNLDFPEIKGFPLLNHYFFGVRSCEVAIIWPENVGHFGSRFIFHSQKNTPRWALLRNVHKAWRGRNPKSWLGPAVHCAKWNMFTYKLLHIYTPWN